ncbi:unnamed protein product [Allacma fusca]|uniref:Acyl carrier protein n=1 Tax=Allacma fusca TaxID=39272 RepID=A0A8J2J949_9HEXA|nr:unnamed protein product [Allacma fusca]
MGRRATHRMEFLSKNILQSQARSASSLFVMGNPVVSKDCRSLFPKKNLLPVESNVQQVRSFAKAAQLTLETIREQVLGVCKQHEKVDAGRLTLNSHFLNDLGLDSLDHIEIIMAIEDEFGFEIPDVESDRLLTPADIAKYVGDKKNVGD